MKLLLVLTAAGVAASSFALPVPASAQVSIAIGAPAGPGWSRWHERRRAARGWDGPTYYGERGPHYGWYSYNNSYYQNCSYRWSDGRRHRARTWQCW